MLLKSPLPASVSQLQDVARPTGHDTRYNRDTIMRGWHGGNISLSATVVTNMHKNGISMEYDAILRV